MRVKCLILAGCLVISACSSTSPNIEPQNWRKPDFVVAFEPSSSAFNNAAFLRTALAAPVVVLIVNTNKDTLDLAEERVTSLSRQLEHKQVYASYLYTDRPADANYVEVFSAHDSAAVNEILAAANKYSLAAQAGRMFAEYDVRQLGFEVKRKTFAWEGRFDVNATQQLISLINQFGWSVMSVPVFKKEGTDLPSKSIEMDLIVVDESFATQVELKALVDTWLNVYGLYGDGYGLAFDRVARKVVIFK